MRPLSLTTTLEELRSEIEKIKVDAATAKTRAALYVTAVAQSIKAAYDVDPDLFKSSSSLLSFVTGDDMGDNPFVIVKESLKGTSKLIIDAAKAIQEVQKIKFDGKIGQKVKYIVDLIPRAILEATLYGKYKDFWENEDSIDKVNDIRKSYERYVAIINNIVGQYKKIYDFVKPDDEDNEANVYLLSNYSGPQDAGKAFIFKADQVVWLAMNGLAKSAYR